MHKPFWSLVAIACTVAAVFCMLSGVQSDPPVEANIVTVCRQDVHQIVAVSGRLAYAEERVAVSETMGIVERVLVKPGQRVGEGEALLRLVASDQEALLSAFAENSAVFKEENNWLQNQGWSRSSDRVVRAEAPCTVRQVLIEENAPLTVGMPMLRLSSNDQIIRCAVAEADLKEIRNGMWAWLSFNGEALGIAKVEGIGELEADPMTGLTYAKVTLKPDETIALPEGAVVDADIFLAGSNDVLALPLYAITPRNTVWWVHDERCTEISAEIVMTDEMNAWVALPEGMMIAVGEFKEGQRIVRAEE